MIFFLNVTITDIRIGYPYHRASWFPISNRFDIFKYALASYAVLEPLTSKFILYVNLAEFDYRRDELEQYLHSIFPITKLEIHWVRLNHTHEWRGACDQLSLSDESIIWYLGNDDHIFIDSSLEMVEAGIHALKNDTDPMAIMYYSHWTSQMRLAMHFNGQLTNDKNFIIYNWNNFDAIHMMKFARFKRYWFEVDCKDKVVYRSDELVHHSNLTIPSNVYAPIKELVRHYDGDSHVGKDLANIAPPLFIPPGFFENQMIIRVGKTKRDNSSTNFNPASEWLYNFSKAGTDYRWLLDDIPLFWKSHIIELDVNYKDYQNLIQARNAAYVASTRIPMHAFGITFTHEDAVPLDWISNNIRG